MSKLTNVERYFFHSFFMKIEYIFDMRSESSLDELTKKELGYKATEKYPFGVAGAFYDILFKESEEDACKLLVATWDKHEDYFTDEYTDYDCSNWRLAKKIINRIRSGKEAPVVSRQKKLSDVEKWFMYNFFRGISWLVDCADRDKQIQKIVQNLFGPYRWMFPNMDFTDCLSDFIYSEPEERVEKLLVALYDDNRYYWTDRFDMHFRTEGWREAKEIVDRCRKKLPKDKYGDFWHYSNWVYEK